LKRALPSEPILVADETILRIFPPLRMAWGMIGRQIRVPITGQNARRVLYGAIHIRSGHRVLLGARTMRQTEFHTFLRKLRRGYRRGHIWLVLDQHGSHGAKATQELARGLRIELLPLPRQCPELNPMDHLWKESDRSVSANRQFPDIDAHAQAVEQWIMGLNPRQALRKAGILSKNFWLPT
jgi:transposase